MHRNARWFWLLTYACAFACTRLAAATNASSTGTIVSPCTTCVLPVYDGRPLYVYAGMQATVQTYDTHYLQITTDGAHPDASGTLLQTQVVDYGPPPVTTFTIANDCEELWYWCGEHTNMQGGRVYAIPSDGTICLSLLPTPQTGSTVLFNATSAPQTGSTVDLNATSAPQTGSTVDLNATSAPPPASASPAATPTPPPASTSPEATPTPPPASASPAATPTPPQAVTYNLTHPQMHCHPSGNEMSQLTLQDCKDACTELQCSAFSFHSESYSFFGFDSLETTSCAICGYRTRVANGTVVIDGNYSSVLAPGLLREMTANHNIYQPVFTQTTNAPLVCDASSVQEWLERAIFAPVLAEVNASAGGALNATREGQLLALLAGSVAANLSHAAEDCSMPEVNTLALLDQARVALRAAGVATAPCAAFSGALLEFALAPALAELNASKQGALNDTHARALRLLLEQQFLPALLANGSTCDPALVSNATLEAQAHGFAQEVLQNPVLAVLFGAVVEAADACAALFEFLAAGSTDGMLQELNATAGGALNATHAAAMAELVQEHLIAPLAASGANCTDLAALSAVMQPRALQLQLALAQHPLFRAHNALPADAEVVVEMTVQLGISRVQFDAAAQRNFRTGIASACSVAVEAVRITAVREVGAGRRRLLQAATQEKLEVDTQIDAAPAQALAVLAAAENSTAVQESVQAEMGGDVQVETVGTPTLAQPQRPAPSPAPSPPRANYAGQHSAKSTDEGTWSIFVVALVLLLFAFIVVFYSALSIRGWGERACVPAPGECPQPPGYLTAQLCHAQTSAPEQQNLLPQAVFRGPYAQLGYAPAFVYAPPPGAPASDAYA